MRNLVILNKGQLSAQSLTYPDLPLVDSVFDPVTDTVTVALCSPETMEVQQLMKNGHVRVLASFPAPDGTLLSFAHFCDSAQLVFVFANGDIVTATYDPEAPDCDITEVEIVGLIDDGILAAAWSPDEETLVVLTRQSSLILLSRLFEPIAEKRLNPDDIKVSNHVSVGWGKEETQFKGKGFKALEREREAIKYAGLDLKEDSALRDPTVAPLQQGTTSAFDNGSVKISWRGDCEFFCVSTREDAFVEGTEEATSRRVIRVFTREGELDSVSEALDGLEHSLAWRPSGSLIASTQRSKDEDGDDVLQVAFFERNGLRHGEFNTRLNPYTENVLDMAWSCNSDVLALQLEDRIQIWTTKNYHWYLKQELYVNQQNEHNKVTFLKFHPEKPLHLMVGTSSGCLLMFNFAYKVASGPTVAGLDVGMVIVIDGCEAKVTPLGIANVPPPIAYRDYDLDQNLLDVAVGSDNESFAAITSTGSILLFHLSLEDMKKGSAPQLSEIKDIPQDEFLKQVCFTNSTCVALIDTPRGSRVALYNSAAELVASYDLDMRAVLLKSRSDFKSAIVERIDGSLLEVTENGVSQIGSFPVLCHDMEIAVVQNEGENSAVCFGVTSNGKLYHEFTQLATGITSIKATQDHLAITNAQLQVCFVHLAAEPLPQSFAFIGSAHADERLRQIERGSILVSCIPSKYSVVLQAPRGNLETICPRIMVLTAVRQFLANLEYEQAFVACRTHRIDLDLLHDYDPRQFFANIELFVRQVKRVDFLDLFVSCLKEEDVTKTKYTDTLLQPELPELAKLTLQPSEPSGKMIINKDTVKVSEKVNKICNAILEVLSELEFANDYLQTRVTAYACQQPPNLAGALTLIASLLDDQEKAITHLCFLADANKLYDHALELYDVKMALAIAQKSQKDPKEYLPFLQNLHVQEPLRKQFLIDDFLGNYKKSLQWLFELGSSAVEELDLYVEKHGLHKEALALYKYDEAGTKRILKLYADSLYAQKKYADAGLTYEHLGDLENAVESYIFSQRWREALAISGNADTALRLVSLLVDDHHYAEAAEIEARYLSNIDEAVRLYCKGYKYDSAVLIAAEHKRPELIESVVDAQLGEGFGVIAELLADCSGQAQSQLKRLRELRQKKQEDPYAFYGMPQDDMDTPDNVSVAASETSTTPSFFTRYTGKTAGTAKTGASRKTSKNRKREERKRAKGRKGTIYEEEYLIKSVGRLVERLDQTRSDALGLIEGLVRRQKRAQAYQLQQNWQALTKFLRENIAEIHNMSEKDRERLDENGEVYLIDEIPVPVIHDGPQLEILDF